VKYPKLRRAGTNSKVNTSTDSKKSKKARTVESEKTDKVSLSKPTGDLKTQKHSLTL